MVGIQQVRRRARLTPTSERPGGWDLVLWILRVKENAKAPDGVVKGSRARGRRGRSTPVKDPVGAGVLIAIRFGVCCEAPQDPVLVVEFKPEATVHGDVARHLIAQHDASPGQG